MVKGLELQAALIEANQNREKLLQASALYQTQSGAGMAWLASAVIATSLHVGAYVTLTHKPVETGPTTQTVVAAVDLELEPAAASAPSEADNATPGPEQQMQEAIEQAATPPPPKPAEEEDVPVLPPTPPDAKTDALLPDMKEVKKEEKPEEPEKPEQQQKAEAPPQEAIEARGGPKSNAQVPTNQAVSDPAWMANVRTRIVRAKRYPAEAHGKTGEALVSVRIGKSGQVEDVQLVVSTGVPALDQEAVAVMRRAAPYAATPSGESQTMRIPISFFR